tara:strand:+ start:781 stop:1995 length:1215 start_codon:yes stop_codon:yes gene_type:complete
VPSPAPCAAPARDRAPRPELADILRAHAAEYRRGRNLAGAQLKAIRAILTCRTAALGGRKLTCDACGTCSILYNSCRNRHCPKCQTLSKERWLQARRAELLETQYFHVVFTLPHELNSLAQGNRAVIYKLLFAAAFDTLLCFGRDPRHLGGLIGGTSILHTWGQNLSQHIHLHCLIPGGALSPDRSRWIPAKPGFLFPVRALSKVFAGKFLEHLQRVYEAGELSFADGTADLSEPAAFNGLLRQLRRHAWVVYCKPPFAGPEHVLEYLGRYTHRVAISNHRILAHQHGKVRFRYKDYRQGGRTRVMELPAQEFIRRFLLHVLPDGLHRIRHFGLLANRTKKDNLTRCRQLLGQPPPTDQPSPESVEQLMLRVADLDIDRCPVCHRGSLQITATLEPVIEPWDTS